MLLINISTPLCSMQCCITADLRNKLNVIVDTVRSLKYRSAVFVRNSLHTASVTLRKLLLVTDDSYSDLLD